MKPIELTLCGWGPYRDKQKIDFTNLRDRGLFLITGATGAGKTTVFDAIIYALYGSMSGQTREKNSVRSDFADRATPTYVELCMEHSGKTYFIYRNPEYLRPKKRKTGAEEMTREKENAILTLPDGKKIEGSNEVTKKIQELLRLDVVQFKQLSMIAQGEFTRLLTAQASEKSRIFREIFNTELYDRIAGGLRQQSMALQKQVMEYRHKMEEDIDLFVPLEEWKEKWGLLTKGEEYCYEEILLFLKELKGEYGGRQKKLEKKAEETDKEIERLAVLMTEGEQTLNLQKRLEGEQEKLETFQSREGEMAQKEKQLEKAMEAAAVKEFETHLTGCRRQKELLLKKIRDVEAELADLKKQKEEKSYFYTKAEELAEAYERAEKAEELRKQHRQAEELYAGQQKELRELQKNYLGIEKMEEQLQADYENADKNYRHGIAGILAMDLEEGMPCPVCGSCSHPDKAKAEEKLPTEEEVEKKKQLFEKKRQELLALHGQTAACRERGEGILKRIEEGKQKLEVFEEIHKKQEEFVKEYIKANTKAAFLNQKKSYEAMLVSFVEKQKRQAELKEEYEEALINVMEAEENFRLQSIAHGFEGEEDYKQAFMEERERRELRESIQKYRQDYYACEHLAAHLKEELAGREQYHAEETAQKLKETREEKSSVYEELTCFRQGAADALRLACSLKEKQKTTEKLSRQYGIWKDLDDAANGNNKKRLVFEQYVLASYFEEILKAANLRLKVMTGGRYELRRMEAVGDGRSKDNLEMEVLDYYTGKYRSVKTLSGGETFKVSLSLALGMSDMVQAFSGGIRVDILFIDEGFGSLDGESLEQACQTLNSLVEKERLIGIISHVPELSEKIENQIRIHKTTTGSMIEVMVS